MAETPSSSRVDTPRFCPWCGAPAPYRSDAHTPRWQELAEERGVEPPEVVQEVLHTDAFVCGCGACKRVSHVIGHEAEVDSPD